MSLVSLQELPEENLKQLDELYKLISPTREAESSYESQLVAASEHIVNYLDAKDKEVAGTTYKDLKTIIVRINSCSYFDAKTDTEEETPESAEEETPVVVENPEASAAPAAIETTGPESEETPVAGPKDTCDDGVWHFTSDIMQIGCMFIAHNELIVNTTAIYDEQCGHTRFAIYGVLTVPCTVPHLFLRWVTVGKIALRPNFI